MTTVTHDNLTSSNDEKGRDHTEMTAVTHDNLTSSNDEKGR